MAFWEGTQAPAVIATAFTFIVLSTVFVIGRFLSRTWLREAPMGIDDWLILPAYVAEICVCIAVLVEVYHGGAGLHIGKAIEIYGTKEQALSRWYKILYALMFCWDWATVFPRLSIIFLYLRIFSNKKVRIACWVLIGWALAYGLAFQFAAMFACVPINRFWNDMAHSKCINFPLFFKLSTVPLIVSDIPMLIIPIPQVWKLETTKLRRIGIIILFMTGLLGFVASVVRLALFFSDTVFTDPTWDSAKINIWTIIEPGMYLIAACSITMRPVVAAIIPVCVKEYTRNWLHRYARGFSLRNTTGTRQSINGNSLELSTWNGRSRLRGHGFGRLEDDRKPNNAVAGTFAAAETADYHNDIDRLTWPSREFEDSIGVRREVWVSKSPVESTMNA